MFLRNATLALFGVIAITSAAAAQGAVPAPPSSAFNWLNLNRQGGSPAQNYYGIVRPNNMFQNGLMAVQQDYTNLSQTYTNTDPNALRATGHAATFMNYSHYYPTLGKGTPGTARPATGVPAPRR
jgi:hypothetical protein